MPWRGDTEDSGFDGQVCWGAAAGAAARGSQWQACLRPPLARFPAPRHLCSVLPLLIEDPMGRLLAATRAQSLEPTAAAHSACMSACGRAMRLRLASLGAAVFNGCLPVERVALYTTAYRWEISLHILHSMRRLGALKSSAALASASETSAVWAKICWRPDIVAFSAGLDTCSPFLSTC